MTHTTNWNIKCAHARCSGRVGIVVVTDDPATTVGVVQGALAAAAMAVGFTVDAFPDASGDCAEQWYCKKHRKDSSLSKAIP